MKEQLLQAMKSCSLKYAKGFERWAYAWQDKRTYEQQADELAKELDLMGFTLIPKSREDRRTND